MVIALMYVHMIVVVEHPMLGRVYSVMQPGRQGMSWLAPIAALAAARMRGLPGGNCVKLVEGAALACKARCV